uniref:beta-glucosidase n=1 Tax=Alexandrium monilatum TaxID=311494 RepID=A0A7S4STC7_9DINO
MPGGDGELWKVVGGAKSGGIMVRFGVDTDSPAQKERLATGAIVRQLKLQGDRLRYEKVEGAGPDTGWISIKFKGADTAVMLNPPKEVTSAAPACQDGFLEFPPDFTWGVATAAYQIEGAANEGGRKPSIWDQFAKTEGKTKRGATGDVACDHYHRWRTDVEILAKLGLGAYRFSISWSRLLPDGDGPVNAVGAKFYSDLIDALLEHGITPWVTIYHWDLPMALQNRFRGWLGPKEEITRAFGHFARTCFELFGDRVKHWVTLNEPGCTSVLGFAVGGKFAPGFDEGHPSLKEGMQEYHCAHNLLLAHAEAARIYRADFKERQGGLLGIAFNAAFKRAKQLERSEDAAAARRAMEFELGWFAGPLFKGDYPASMVECCKERLPKFTKEEKALLLGSCDFFGINNYFSGLCLNLTSAKQQGFKMPNKGFHDDQNAYTVDDDAWERTDQGWAIVPWGFRDLLLYIQEQFKPPCGIIVTENGCAHERDQSKEHDEQEGVLVPRPYDAAAAVPEDLDGETYDDPDRVRYYRAHLAAVHAARAKGADVRGYFAWSFMDNFEWEDGYDNRFGIVRVDYQTQRRTIKASARFLAEVAKNRGLEAPPKSEQYKGLVF